MGKSLNEKIFENGKIFQYQEINESQEIINHIAINLFTEKTCLSDISEIKKKLSGITAMVSKEAGTKKRYTNGSIRPTNLTSLAMTGVTPQQIATSLNLQQSYAEQERYKRLGEMMSEDEKRKVSLINTASGRAALRGKVNKFGTLDARPNEKKVLYDKFKSVMNGGGGQEESTTEGMVSDISVGSKVLAKIRAFPYWPAVIEAISDDGIITVKFPDGKLGMNATVVALTPESMKKQLETGKFKKGAHLREAFLTDVSLMGFNQ